MYVHVTAVGTPAKNLHFPATSEKRTTSGPYISLLPLRRGQPLAHIVPCYLWEEDNLWPIIIFPCYLWEEDNLWPIYFPATSEKRTTSGPYSSLLPLRRGQPLAHNYISLLPLRRGQPLAHIVPCYLWEEDNLWPIYFLLPLRRGQPLAHIFPCYLWEEDNLWPI